MNANYINHLMGCKACYAPAGRYCEEGMAVKIESDAEYVCTLKTVNDRRRVMASFQQSYAPDNFKKLEEKARELFKASRVVA